MAVISQIIRQSDVYSQKKISADLAHLNEFEDSPKSYSPLPMDRNWAIKPMRVDSRFRLSKGTLKTYDEITVNSSLLMLDNVPTLSKINVPQVLPQQELHQNYTHQKQVQTKSTGVSPMEPFANLGKLQTGNYANNSSSNLLSSPHKPKKAIGQVTLKIQAFEIEELENTIGLTSGQRMTAQNRFRSEMMGQPIQSKLATGHSMRVNKNQLAGVINPTHRPYHLPDSTTMGSIIWDRGAISVSNAPSDSMNNRKRPSAFPSIKRQSEGFSTSSKRQLNKDFHKSALGIQRVMDGLKPVHNIGQSSMSALNSQNDSSIQGNQPTNANGPPSRKNASIGRGGPRFGHKEFKPARVDIGLRGHMPFDNVLLLKSDMNSRSIIVNQEANKSPNARRRSMFVVDNSERRANKSELGMHQTVVSMRTTNQALIPSLQSELANDDSVTAVSTNHPSTLLKGLNPRIGPKNIGSEQARKKVQNLIKKNRKPNFSNNIASQENESSLNGKQQQIQCKSNKGNHIEMCEADVFSLNAQKVVLSPYQRMILETPQGMETAMLSSSGNNDEHIEIKGEADVRIQSQDSSTSHRTGSRLRETMTSGTRRDQYAANSSKKRSQDVRKSKTPSILKVSSRRRKSVNEHTIFEAPERLGAINATGPFRRVSARQNEQVTPQQDKIVLENMNTNTHRLLQNNDSVGSNGELYTVELHFVKELQSEKSVNCNALEEESAVHSHSSQEEITIKMGRPSVNVAHSFNNLQEKDIKQSEPQISQLWNIPAQSVNQESQEDHLQNQKVVVKSSPFQNPIMKSTSVDARTQKQTQHSPFSSNRQSPDLTFYIADVSKDQSIEQQQQQKLQIQSIMRENFLNQKKQQAQSMFTTQTNFVNPYASSSLNTTKYLNMKQPLIKNQQNNRHAATTYTTSQMGANTRLGSLEAALESRKLNKIGFKDPMLNMLSAIHTYDKSEEAKSTLYGFRTRKSSCQPRIDSTLLKNDLEHEQISGQDPMRSSTYKISKVPGFGANKQPARLLLRNERHKVKTFDDARNRQHDSTLKPKKQTTNLVITVNSKISKALEQNQINTKSYSPTRQKAKASSPRRTGLTTSNYGTKEQSSVAGSRSPASLQRRNKMPINSDLHDADKIIVRDAQKSKNPFSGEFRMQVSAGDGATSGGQSPGAASYRQMINGGNGASVVMSKMGHVTSRGRSQPPLTSDSPDRRSDQNSTVQMIELELPNLQADETKVSPPRVKVLSKDFEHHMGYAANTYSRGENVATGESKPVIELNSVEQSEICSDAEILRRMPATMRNSLNSGTNHSQSNKSLEQVMGPAAALVNINSGDLCQDHNQVVPEEKVVFIYHESLIQAKSPKDVVKRLILLQQQAKEKHQFSKEFCLQSGPAIIHNDMPVLQKLQYFDNLKQRDAQLKILHAQMSKLKSNDAKQKIIQHKQKKQADGKTKGKNKHKEVITTKTEEDESELLQAQEKHVKSLKLDDLGSDRTTFDSQLNSKPHTPNLSASPANEQINSLDQALPTRRVVPINSFSNQIPDVVQIGINHRGRTRQLEDCKQQTDITGTDSTTGTIDLPEAKLREMEFLIYREASLTQLAPAASEVKECQTNFVQLRQSQLENADLQKRVFKSNQINSFIGGQKRRKSQLLVNPHQNSRKALASPTQLEVCNKGLINK